MTKLLSIIALFSAVSLLGAADYELTPLAPPSAGKTGDPPFYRFSPEETGITAINLHNDPRMWGELFRELTLGAVETGLAVADFDHNGRPDIYAVSKNGPCALYLQTGAFQFKDVAAQAGVSANVSNDSKAGATAVDINQDGWMDIYVCRYDAPNLLFINQQDGTFIEAAADYRLNIKDASVHASFADYDRDGDLDAYLVTNVLRFSESPQGRPDYLLRNNGNGAFENVANETGIWGISQGHTAIWFDPNHDGWPDLYVANDFETPDRYYINQGDGTFVDVVDDQLPHVTYFSMGADSGDINNDGLIDFMVADMRDRTRAEYMAAMEEMGRGLWEMERARDLLPQYTWNALYLNSGTERLMEMAHMAGMEATGWTWATRMLDLDCDGRLDLFFTNGMIRNFMDADLIDRQKVTRTIEARAALWKNSPARKEPNLAFRNNGDLTFNDVSSEWGLSHTGVSFGCATVDMDQDGDLDLVYVNYNEPPTVIRNDITDGNRLIISLTGRTPNLQAIGSEVVIETSSGRQIRQVYPERGIVSSEPTDLHFGLADETLVNRITVRWPNGAESILKEIPSGNLLTIIQPAGKPSSKVVREERSPLFQEVANSKGLSLVTQNQRIDELSTQRLLPRRLNGLGPDIATADVNGDGLTDIFITGSSGQCGALFLADDNGNYRKADNQPWKTASDADDLGAAFIDIDSDLSLDLVVTAGGVSFPEGDPQLNDRVYMNDGHGNFAADSSGILPPSSVATQAIATADFDGDGDEDLFIGGRYVPGQWPATPTSFLYENRNGRFVDISKDRASSLSNIGMVTDAQFKDINNDQLPDLLLSIEWGAVTVFVNSGNGFENQTESLGLSKRTGWWKTLKAIDLNNDGLVDIIAGNTGLNTKYRASEAEPATLFTGFFGDPRRTHIVEAQFENGDLYPVRGLSKLRYSFPRQTRKFRTFKQFSSATLESIFTATALAETRKLEATELKSGVFYQQPSGRFKFVPLPPEAQLAPIFTLSTWDINQDGFLDLFIAGNSFSPEPSTGRFDGGIGLMLTNDRQGSFTPIWPKTSGISISGEARASSIINNKLVIARTNGSVLLYEKQTP